MCEPIASSERETDRMFCVGCLRSGAHLLSRKPSSEVVAEGGLRGFLHPKSLLRTISGTALPELHRLVQGSHPIAEQVLLLNVLSQARTKVSWYLLPIISAPPSGATQCSCPLIPDTHTHAYSLSPTHPSCLKCSFFSWSAPFQGLIYHQNPQQQ